MKIIKSLESFDKVDEKLTPERAKASFSISTNLKKVAKIQKTFIDAQQLLTEMSDEVVALKLSYDNLDSEAERLITNMKGNIDNMLNALKRKDNKGHITGMIDNISRCERNLEKLKSSFLNKHDKLE